MGKERSKTTDSSSLRGKAEEKLKKRQKSSESLPRDEADVRRLLHELQVHQIELEMQNEELRRPETRSKKFSTNIPISMILLL
jgi:hypothetical protein